MQALYVLVGGGSYKYEISQKILEAYDSHVHIIDPMIQDEDPDVEYQNLEAQVDYLENMHEGNERYGFERVTYADYSTYFHKVIGMYGEENIFFDRIFILVFSSDAYDGAIELKDEENGIYVIDFTRSLTECIYVGNEFLNFRYLSYGYNNGYNKNFSDFIGIYNSVANIYEMWVDKELYDYELDKTTGLEFCKKYREILKTYRSYLDEMYNILNSGLIKCMENIEKTKYEQLDEFMNRINCHN